MDQRITFEQGVDLFQRGELSFLQERAHAIRNEKNPPGHVTFILDTNPNYTNVCNVDCSFCAFYRHENHKEAYTKSVEEVMTDLQRAVEAGVTTVLLQGGVHPRLTLGYYVALVSETRRRFPSLHPHFFSAVELANCAEVSGLPLQEVLERLWEAGLRTIPGGGAEILSERVRRILSPKKMGEGGWIAFHRLAHKVGYKTTATMMYGHVETAEDVITHLETLRTAQEENPGFLNFIPWSYKSDSTALGRRVRRNADPTHYFRLLALARIYLDNFPHIGASWFGEGKENGMRALHYGADDFGGTLLEENVHRAARWINQTDGEALQQMIREAGFIPVQRNSFFEPITETKNFASTERGNVAKLVPTPV